MSSPEQETIKKMKKRKKHDYGVALPPEDELRAMVSQTDDLNRLQEFLEGRSFPNGSLESEYPYHTKDKTLLMEFSMVFTSASSTVLKICINAGADIHLKDSHGRTALHYALLSDDNPQEFKNQPDYSEQGDILGKINVLLQAGADVNAVDKFGRTPLHYAVVLPMDIESRKTIINRLIAAGANVNAQCTLGETLLHLASEQLVYSPNIYETKNSLETVKFLLGLENINPNLRRQGCYYGTPLDMAEALLQNHRSMTRPEYKKTMEEIIQLLKDHGVEKAIKPKSHKSTQQLEKQEKELLAELEKIRGQLQGGRQKENASGKTTLPQLSGIVEKPSPKATSSTHKVENNGIQYRSLSHKRTTDV